MWFGDGLGLPWQVNVIKSAFKFLLQLLKLSQKHMLDVNTVVWDGLEVWRWFGVFWGGLGCFHGPSNYLPFSNCLNRKLMGRIGRQVNFRSF